MILNSTNQYLLKIQVTVIPNFKNKEQLSAMLNARKGKSMEAIMQSTYNIPWSALNVITAILKIAYALMKLLTTNGA